jgi:peptidoglycan/xylan/chitin deacetylase (PgdA/CDA1 family)
MAGDGRSIVARLRAGLSLLFAALLDLISRWSGRAVGLVVVYHRIGERQEDRHAHLVAALGSGLFEDQLRHLERRYRLVPASELVRAVAARRRGQRFPVSVTFDDDLPSHVRVAMPILRRAGIPAAFFLSGASLSRPFAFWWERLQVAFDRGLLGADELRLWAGPGPASTRQPDIRTVARAIEAMPPERRDQVADGLLDRLGSDPPDAGLEAAGVRALVDAGFEIGFHTLRHDPLPPLDDEGLKRAMVEGRAELEALLPHPITMISYPHGKADLRVAAAARGAGYLFGFTNAPDPLVPATDPLLIGRLYPTYESVGQFAMEVSRTLRKSRSSRWRAQSRPRRSASLGQRSVS